VAPLPSDLLTLGLDSETSDVLIMLLRIAYPNNTTAMSEYYSNTPVSVLRVTSPAPSNDDDHPPPTCDSHYCTSDAVFKKNAETDKWNREEPNSRPTN